LRPAPTLATRVDGERIETFCDDEEPIGDRFGRSVAGREHPNGQVMVRCEAERLDNVGLVRDADGCIRGVFRGEVEVTDLEGEAVVTRCEHRPGDMGA